MRRAILYRSYNLKNVKNANEGMLLLTTSLKVTILHAYFSLFLNLKLRKASQLHVLSLSSISRKMK